MGRLARAGHAAKLSALLLLAGIGPALSDDRAAAAARYAVVVEDCAGTVAEFLPTVRRGGRNLIDGIGLTGRGAWGQVVLVAEQVRRWCASALRDVEIVVETPCACVGLRAGDARVEDQAAPSGRSAPQPESGRPSLAHRAAMLAP